MLKKKKKNLLPPSPSRFLEPPEAEAQQLKSIEILFEIPSAFFECLKVNLPVEDPFPKENVAELFSFLALAPDPNANKDDGCEGGEAKLNEAAKSRGW